MATPYQIRVRPDETGLLGLGPQSEEAAAKVSELLQKDMESHHVFWNTDNFHDHIAHHLLTLYGTGADPQAFQEAYDVNKDIQAAAHAPSRKPDIVAELEADWAAHAPRYLGQGQYYPDFLLYFQRQIEKQSGSSSSRSGGGGGGGGGDGGWEAVMHDHLLADTPSAADMRARLFAGFLHPLIQLGYGIKWRQPALVATGLAQTAVHEDQFGELMSQVHEAVATAENEQQDQQREHHRQTPLVEILEAAREKHPELATSARWSDRNRITDGVLTRARPQAVALLASIRVRPEELAERTAEMVRTAAYIAASAACNPPHVPKFCFFLIHHLTSIPFFLSLNKLDWVSDSSKAHLLEWKLRFDAIQYFARGCPPLRRDAVRSPFSHNMATATAAVVTNEEPLQLVPRLQRIVDDGHLIKLVRALLLAQRESRPYLDRPWIRIPDDAAWRHVMHLVLVSVNGNPDPFWVRSAGFKEAWEKVPIMAAQ